MGFGIAEEEMSPFVQMGLEQTEEALSHYPVPPLSAQPLGSRIGGGGVRFALCQDLGLIGDECWVQSQLTAHCKSCKDFGMTPF